MSKPFLMLSLMPVIVGLGMALQADMAPGPQLWIGLNGYCCPTDDSTRCLS